MRDKNWAWCDACEERTRHFDYGDRHKCEVCETFNYTDSDMSDHAAEKAADEVRDELLHPLNEQQYNQGVDEAVERMKERWKRFG